MVGLRTTTLDRIRSELKNICIFSIQWARGETGEKTQNRMFGKQRDE